MKTHLPTHLVIGLLLLFGTNRLKAQALQVSATSVASICFNDGSITASATGGSIPYSFVITSGPSVAGLTFPFLPTNGVDQFLSIPSGQYTLVVHDNAGDSSQMTVTVGGSYQFPVLTYVVSGGITITVNATLGKPPYTYAISSVASNGPFGPSQSSNVFDTLCNGTYYVRVTDACSNIYTTIGIVIYRPPVDILNTNCVGSTSTGHTTYVSIVQGTGTPPYTYKDFSGGNLVTNSSGHFTIAGFCPDTMIVTDGCAIWDSVRKDCFPLNHYEVVCNDCVSGIVTLRGIGNCPPFTYTLINANGSLGPTNQTGYFNNLPIGPSYYDFYVDDICGRRSKFRVRCMQPQVYTKCPFNNDVDIILFGDIDYPATVTCTTCNPPQTVTLTSSNSINMPGVQVGFHTFVFTDSCGVPITRTFFVDTGTIDLDWTWRSCNDVTFNATNGLGVDVTLQTLFELTNTTGFYRSNMTGLFDNVPDGTYTITANYPSCRVAQWQIQFPHFPTFCQFPTFNSACTPSYDLKLPNNFGSNDLPEMISLRSLTLGINVAESPAGGFNGSNFNDMPVGNYQLVSDSGCQRAFVLPPHPHVIFQGYDSVDCLDQHYIIATINPKFLITNCGDTTYFTFRVFQHDSIIGTNITGRFQVPDTGDYLVKLYYRVANVNKYPPVPFAFNDSCAADTLHIHALPKTLPFVYSQDVQVCGLNALGYIHYTIHGGIHPYTMHVPNLGTYAVQDTQGILPNLPMDNYTLIVYDNCGISNSLTVTVADTCFVCGTLSLYLPLDTNACARTTVTYNDTSAHVQLYTWYVNGIPMANTAQFSYHFDTVGYYSIMSIGANISCIDTTIHLVHATDVDSFYMGSDLGICYNDSIALHSPLPNVHWFNGDSIHQQVMVYGPGDYWAISYNQCGPYTDSINVSYRNINLPNLGQINWICAGDSLTLHATDSTYSSYLWQDGSGDSIFVVHSPGLYWVEVSADSCVVRDSIVAVAGVDPPDFELGNDSVYCDNFQRTLQTPYQNTIWSTGDTAILIQASTPAIYWAEVQNNCGILRDSIELRVVSFPGFTLGSDTFICDHTPYLLNAPLGADSVLWSDSSKLFELPVTDAGVYWLKYYKEVCQWGDTVVIQNSNTPKLELPVILPSCGNEFTITPHATDVTYRWSDGSSDTLLHVTQSGWYSVTVTNRCGSDSTDVQVVLMGNDCRLVVPNAFTPNGDSKNDEFKVLTLCSIKQFTMRIYDRWGVLVHESLDVDAGWDGRFKGDPQPAGTYVIYIRYFDECENAMNNVQTALTIIR